MYVDNVYTKQCHKPQGCMLGTISPLRIMYVRVILLKAYIEHNLQACGAVDIAREVQLALANGFSLARQPSRALDLLKSLR